jgi:hypothetical protein
VKYDDASWHRAGGDAAGRSAAASETPMGMYFGWAVLRGLADEAILKDFQEDLVAFQRREVPPAELVRRVCDSKLTSDCFNTEGNHFSCAYYGGEMFYDDWIDLFVDASGPDPFGVADAWDNFDQLAEVLDRRYDDWKLGRLGQSG